MNNATPSLTKTCSSCGLSKPLSAFLQISGPEGSTYTNICSTCRKAYPEGLKSPDKDESTTSDTSHSIDSKSKVKAETDKRDLSKQIEENYFDEREKNELTQAKQIEKKGFLSRSEKEHRETYLKKGSFLDNARKNQPVDAANVHGSAAQAMEAEKFNFAAPIEGMRTPQLKHSGSVFNSFKAWLGGSAPIAKATHQAKASADQAKKAPTQTDVTEYIDNTWGPNSRKR
jgi:hypothetical protein